MHFYEVVHFHHPFGQLTIKKISPSGDAGSMSCRERDFRRPIDEIQIRLQKHQKKSR
jgi:hypothetical protein